MELFEPIYIGLITLCTVWSLHAATRKGMLLHVLQIGGKDFKFLTGCPTCMSPYWAVITSTYYASSVDALLTVRHLENFFVAMVFSMGVSWIVHELTPYPPTE